MLLARNALFGFDRAPAKLPGRLIERGNIVRTLIQPARASGRSEDGKRQTPRR
jgi:hypothetical protein